MEIVATSGALVNTQVASLKLLFAKDSLWNLENPGHLNSLLLFHNGMKSFNLSS